MVTPRSFQTAESLSGNTVLERVYLLCKAPFAATSRVIWCWSKGMGDARATFTVEQLTWEERPITVTWQPAPFRPSRRLTTQVLGLCFTPGGRIVLVSGNETDWTLPGGSPEEQETLEEALAREVWEEARARIVNCTYIGCQRVEDPGRHDGPTLYYQTRFWARVEMAPFSPQFETVARKLVRPDEFLSTLTWGHSAMARIILDEAMRLERLTTHGLPRQS